MLQYSNIMRTYDLDLQTRILEGSMSFILNTHILFFNFYCNILYFIIIIIIYYNVMHGLQNPKDKHAYNCLLNTFLFVVFVLL